MSLTGNGAINVKSLMQHRAVQTLLAPAKTPVTVAFAKNYIREVQSRDDEIIEMLIDSSTSAVETWLRRKLITQKFTVTFDSFPHSGLAGLSIDPFWGSFAGISDDGVIELPCNPVQSVEEIRYVDETNTVQILAADQYFVDVKSEPARIVPAFQKLFPDTVAQINSLSIDITSGYGPDPKDIPAEIRTVILQLIANDYENRESQSEFILRKNQSFLDHLNSFRIMTLFDT